MRVVLLPHSPQGPLSLGFHPPPFFLTRIIGSHFTDTTVHWS